MSPILGGTAPPLVRQCWINAYDCGDFSTRFEAQAFYLACGGRKNDLHRLDRDHDGWDAGLALTHARNPVATSGA